MFYKRSPVSGRVVAADANAYNPAAFQDGNVPESKFRFGFPTPIVSDGSKEVASSVAAAAIPKRLQKTRELQRLFLLEDGIPVHLKRGARDVIPYRLTLALSGVGMVYFSYALYRMAYGIK